MANIGFIGAGVIASSIIEGFCNFGPSHRIFVSDIDKQKTVDLETRHHNVTARSANQDVLDDCE